MKRRGSPILALVLPVLGVLLAAPPCLAAEVPDGACLECHGDPQVRADTEEEGPRPPYVNVRAGANSMHRALACVECHAGIGALPHSEPLEAVDCGACHAAVAAEYGRSIHGRRRAAGVLEAPGCAACHGEHTVAAPADPASRVAPRNIPATCAACHEEERLALKYGLPRRRFATYLDSYHGIVNRFGEAAAANCASCHGAHAILPATDPSSSIHPDNLGNTCGTCHPGAEKGLAGARVHVEATAESSKGMYYVRTFYTYFTGGLMACFVAYMAVETYGLLRRRRRR